MKKQLQTIFSTRQHMLSKNFEIYYYDVAHFSGISNHTHNYYEFYFFLNGNVSMFIDGIPFKFLLSYTNFCSNCYYDRYPKKLLLRQTILEVDNLLLCPPLGIPLLLKSAPHAFHEKHPIQWSNYPFPE